MPESLILDFDNSVIDLPDARRVALQQHQEAIRFACSMKQLNDLALQIAPALGQTHGTVFMGSGDFHHVSFALIRRVAAQQPIEVVVLDNHPDNMRWPLGIHCGSWVRHVTQLPNVKHVHVLGITSRDISAGHLWENYFTPLLRGRLTYWSVGQTIGPLHRLGWSSAFRNFSSADVLCEAFAEAQARSTTPVYFSIDKDAFSPDLVCCNWDQGCMEERHANAVLAALRGRIVASDITGEISDYRYRARWKRWMSSLDAQPAVDANTLVREQTRHSELNQRLAARIDECMSLQGASAQVP